MLTTKDKNETIEQRGNMEIRDTINISVNKDSKTCNCPKSLWISDSRRETIDRID